MQDKLSYITSNINNYQTVPVTVVENYEWNMFDHINTTVLYLNSQYKTGKDDNKPFKNILRPILNLAHRAEGFDLKDIEMFVDSQKDYYKSFLVKKYHSKWARENKIDTLIDEIVEGYTDFGGVLVKNVNKVRPEVVPWQRIAFCDQTDVLSGAICEKHNYSPDQLRKMGKKHWKNIEEVILLSDTEKSTPDGKKKNKTPSKYIEVYELHGTFPNSWLKEYDDEYSEDDEDYSQQMHIVTFYVGQDNQSHCIDLYKGKEKEFPYKFVARDAIYGRALGLGGAEELFEPQVWTNYDVIRMKGMLDIASKVIFQTSDQAFARRNKITNLNNGEILTTEDGKPLSQINTTPVNMRVFENSVSQWEEHARVLGAAGEAMMGDSPSAGTPFKLQELVAGEGHALHEYRKGKLAVFLDEIYKDWIIPYIAKEITNGQEFLSELDLDEMQYISEAIANCKANEAIIERILNGQPIYPDEVELYKQQVTEDFKKGENRKFIEILADELKDAPLDVRINIVGKQKDLNKITDKLTNIFRVVMANPMVLQAPGMSKLFNQIIESSGLDPVDFTSFTKPQPQLVQPQQQMAEQQMEAQKQQGINQGQGMNIA